MSPQVQNELINIAGESILKEIIDEVREAQFYSVMADEVVDISNREQLTVVVRFVDKKGKLYNCNQNKRFFVKNKMASFYKIYIFSTSPLV